MKHFNFELDKSKKIVEGKPHWDHSLTIFMEKKGALYLLKEIADQLEHENDDKIIMSFMMGYLSKEDEISPREAALASVNCYKLRKI